MIEKIHVFVAEAGGAQGSGLELIIPMGAIIIIFFWMTHRSQKKKTQERREMLDSIKVGDDVVTIGGIHGRVTKINQETFDLRVNKEKDIKVRFNRAAVNKVLKQEGEETTEVMKSRSHEVTES